MTDERKPLSLLYYASAMERMGRRVSSCALSSRKECLSSDMRSNSSDN
jgi:hypothetical protein